MHIWVGEMDFTLFAFLFVSILGGIFVVLFVLAFVCYLCMWLFILFCFCCSCLFFASQDWHERVLESLDSTP